MHAKKAHPNKKMGKGKKANMKIQQTEWDLDALLPRFKSPQHNAYVKEITALVDTFISDRTLLTSDIPVHTFKQLAAQIDDISFRLEKLAAHANFLYSKNVKDQVAKQYVAFVEDLATDISNKLMYFEMWFIKLPQEKAYELADSMGEDAHSFRRRYEHGKHILTEAEEKIINYKDLTGSDALVKLYNSIVSGWTFEFDGKKHSLSQLSKFLHHADRRKRKAADAVIESKFREYEELLGDIYVALAKDYDIEQIKLRKHQTPLSVRASNEEISVTAITALFDAVKNKRKVFHDFFKLRAKLLGLKKMETYDLFAPLTTKQPAKIPYDVAMNKVFAAIDTISPDFLKLIEKLVAQRHVDSVFHPNKMSGAYNYGLSHGVKPYVFMQYLGVRFDMYTIVHEFGHAVHSMHMNKYNTYTAHAPIGICESVSTFFEEILFEQELATASPAQQKELLAWKLSDLFSAVSNGAYVSYYETIAHDLVRNGATHQDLTKQWTKIKAEQLGPAVSLRPSLIGWMGIPHIYEMPFYYYNYAVGNLIALLFLAQFKKDPVTFRKQFVKYLSVGGTAGTVETLKIMGIDVENPKTWEFAFEILNERVILLKKLVR